MFKANYLDAKMKRRESLLVAYLLVLVNCVWCECNAVQNLPTRIRLRRWQRLRNTVTVQSSFTGTATESRPALGLTQPQIQSERGDPSIG